MQTFTLQVGNSYTLEDIPETHRELLTNCHHRGACDNDVAEALPYFAIDNKAGLRRYLKEFGAWNDAELQNDNANLSRLLWIMAGDIQEQHEAYIGI